MKNAALLLAGPTGCGKSPLGDFLERYGLAGLACAHFDFGARLRTIADHGQSGISDQDRSLITGLLRTGALFEKTHFPLVGRIFTAFQAHLKPDLTILNGLPRDVAQAQFIDSFIKVQTVVYLSGRAEIIRERIRLNTGGDRLGRTDDETRKISEKLRIFRERTLPLLDYYRHRGIPVFEFPVHITTTPDMIQPALAAKITDCIF